MPELDPGVGGGELPIGFGIFGISPFRPCGDLGFEGQFVGDASIQAL